jgi:endonuclease-8
MPEGDTIWRTARTLGRTLGGRRIERFRTSVPLGEPTLVGCDVVDVESRGKNLLIWFSDRRALYTHMRMTGSWHVYRRDEPWQRPEHQANLALDTSDHVAVCFNAPVVELLTELGVRRHRFLSRLGPDLLADRTDLQEVLRRVRQRPDAPFGEVVMAQDVVCGIGNVYKSETLFLEGVNPFAPARALNDPQVVSVLEQARRLMLFNLTGYPRVTRFVPGGGRYWVYGRRAEPCHRCGASIAMRRQGDAGRSTYWCPACQATPT